MCVDNLIRSVDAQPFGGGELSAGRWVVAAGEDVRIVAKGDESVDLIIVDDESNVPSSIDIEVPARGALNIVHVVTKVNDHKIDIRMGEGAEVNMTQLVLAAAEVATRTHLNGENGRFQLGGSFVLTDEQKGGVTVDVEHAVANCVSRTAYRGVASGKAKGRFSGLVYIAKDAQKTDAEQLSRNVTMDEALIHTEPQMEIYADDVRCSHGATVGQMDEDAILYMRQRGLSKADAKRLQIHGFVADTTLHASIAGCGEAMMELLMDKLAKL